MLGFFSGPKSGHPLASAAETRQIAAELVRGEAAKSVDDATAWFESLAGVPDFAPALRLERTLEIANASLAHVRRLSREFLADGNEPLTRDRQRHQLLWQRNHAYWVRLEDALQRVLADAGQDRKFAALPLALTNVIVALSMQLRWLQFDHQPIVPALWERLGQAYLQAVEEQGADRIVVALGCDETGTTATREYLKTIAFRASSPDNLQPQQIAVADRLIASFLPRCALTASPVAGCIHWVDATRPEPPARLAQMPPPSPGLRFLFPGTAPDEMRTLREKIAASRVVPREIAGVEEFSADLVLRVLDHLLQCWSPKPPLRKAARHRIASDVYVVRGLDDLLRFVAGNADDITAVATWTAEDASQGGLGARLPIKRNEVVAVGMLVGFQPPGNPGWNVGVVRRYSRLDEQQGLAGIEILSPAPRVLTAMDSGLRTDLLLLDTLKDDSSVRILLAPSHWEGSTTYVGLVDGRPWRLHADEAVEQAGDWLLGRCIAEELRD